MPSHVTPAPLRLALTGLILACAALAGCSSADKPVGRPGGYPVATSPSTTTDPGSRYLDAARPLGAISVETPPVDGSWTGGPTSIARPPASPTPSTADLPPPPVRRTPPPPPPPPLPSR